MTTHVFELAVVAGAEDVWRAITSGRHLQGVELASDWQPGSVVEGRAEGVTVGLRGEVLAADPPHRLSLVFETTHLTWEISSCAVRLFVDELAGCTDEDAAAVWCPVMASLERALRGAVGDAAESPST